MTEFVEMDKKKNRYFQSRMCGDTSVACSNKEPKKVVNRGNFFFSLFIFSSFIYTLAELHTQWAMKKALAKKDSWNKCAETLNADIFSMLRVENTSQKWKTTDWYYVFARSLLINSNALAQKLTHVYSSAVNSAHLHYRTHSFLLTLNYCFFSHFFLLLLFFLYFILFCSLCVFALLFPARSIFLSVIVFI